MKTRPPTASLTRRSVGYALATSTGLIAFVVASPFLARLYSPAEFGAYGIFTAITAVLGTVSTLRYELAIILPSDDREARQILRLCIVAVWTAGGVFLLGAAAVYAFLTATWGVPVGPGLLWSLPIGATFAGTQLALNYWTIRGGQYRALGMSRLAQGVVTVAIQLTVGPGLGYMGLVSGDLAGRLAALLPVGWLAISHASRSALFSWEALKNGAMRFINFPKFSAPSAAVNSLGLMAPTVLIAALFGVVPAGFYALGQRLVVVPSLMVGEVAANVYSGEAARAQRQERVSPKRRFLRLTGAMALVGIPMFGALAFAGPWAFSIVFGAQWAEAGTFARFLAAGFLAQFVVDPVSQTLNILERQAWQFGWDILRLVLVCTGILAAAFAGLGARGAVVALSIAITLAYATLWSISLIAVNKHDVSASATMATNGTT